MAFRRLRLSRTSSSSCSGKQQSVFLLLLLVGDVRDSESGGAASADINGQ